MALLHVVGLAITLVLCVSGESLSPRVGSELYLYRLRVQVLTRRLEETCPHLLPLTTPFSGDPASLLTGTVGKRELIENTVMYNHALQAEKEVHDHILLLLQKCGGKVDLKVAALTRPRPSSATTKQQASTTATPVVTTEQTTTPPLTTTPELPCRPELPTTPELPPTLEPPTTPEPTTIPEPPTTPEPTTVPEPPTTPGPETTVKLTTMTELPTTPSTEPTTTKVTVQPFPFRNDLPKQCYIHTVLTDSWRNNNTDPSLRYSDKGTLDKGRKWFRFSGAAGNLMRNTCPVKYACGGTAAYWSESKMPTKVGMTKIYILYDSLTDDPVTEPQGCKVKTVYRGTVTRCSEARDGLVYTVVDEMSGNVDTVCGMN